MESAVNNYECEENYHSAHKKQDVRYCYALDKNNHLVSIKDASNMANTFVCPHCKSEMIKKCGQHNAWHFAHKNKQCDYD